MLLCLRGYSISPEGREAWEVDHSEDILQWEEGILYGSWSTLTAKLPKVDHSEDILEWEVDHSEDEDVLKW